jgi:capsular exopolysaccharide family
MNTDYTSNTKVGSKNESFEFNIKEILMRYLHYSWLFALGIAIALLVAWLYLRYTPPQYKISATMLIRNDGSRGNTGSDVFSELSLYRESTNKQNEIEILKSRAMMMRVVDSLGLQYSYFVVGNVKTTNIYRESPFELEFLDAPSNSLSLDIHFKDRNSFSIGDNPKVYVMGEPVRYADFYFRLVPRETNYSEMSYRDYIVKWMPTQMAAMSLSRGLIVESMELSSMLQLNYITENPRLGADIINTLMAEYNKAAIEDKNQINRNILAFINDRLILVDKQLDSVERDLQSYKTGKQVLDLPSQSNVYFNNMIETNETIRKQEINIGVIELLENYLNSPEHKLTLVPSTLGIQDGTLQILTDNYNKLIDDRTAQLQTGATVNSPAVKNIEEDIEQARIKLLQALANIKAATMNTIASLRSQNQNLNKELASIPLKERESREKLRQQESKQSLYLYLLQKKEESSIAEASTIANSRVLDHALPIQTRVSPMPARVYAIAVLAGVVIPVIIVYLITLLNDKVTTKSDILKSTETPIVGEIGHSQLKNMLLFPEKSRSVVAEQLRIVRTNLRFILGELFEKPVIMITSSFSGEGKSFISTNLGAVMALSGKRTVVLEFDLRKPKIITNLGLTKGQGLTNFLVGAAHMENLPQPVPQVDNLYVISSGPVPPNPAEILLSSRIDELFTWLRSQFEVIIIDTAPVGLVSDAVTLNQYANSTLYVIRQRYTFKRQLNFINDLYVQNKLNRMGLIVNDVVSSGSASYYGYGGAHYGYGYGYGNGNGYYEEEKKEGLWTQWKKKLSIKAKSK